jgi:hypothetical protein
MVFVGFPTIQFVIQCLVSLSLSDPTIKFFSDQVENRDYEDLPPQQLEHRSPDNNQE